MKQDGKLFIDGSWTDGQGAPLTSTNPANGEPIWQGAQASEAQLESALAAAHSAFGSWRRLSVEERFAIIERYAAIAKERQEEMAKLISDEMGKALWDARTEAGAIAGKAAISIEAYHERTPTRNEGAIRLTHRPHGVMVVIGPFNFPGHLPNGHIIPALIAGNTIVFKPSEITPAVAQAMVGWWEEAGLPPGVINLVQGGAAEAGQLIEDKRTRGVLFTGGVKAGLAIHRTLAGHPDKILALELGGNNPLIAWDVADAESAATVIARSAFITSGQRCTCARRLIVPHGAAGDRIIDAVASLISRLAVDRPDADPQPFIGPVVHSKAADAILKAQEELLFHGGEAVRPSLRLDQGSAYVTPGLIDTTRCREVRDEEVFGPLLQVFRTKTFDDAIAKANDTRFGLSAGLLSDDEQLWHRFADQIDAGIVNWNRQTTGASGKAPFGGPGLSGNHRPAGYYAADYCAWPMASMVQEGALNDDAAMPGLVK
ncbi:succinylglutamate-semialdehyde dehydrogenase [Parvularcula sp. LCG005]|uniref:succinylglutamate-semialdehyde dehydrogenase n=1 Tax=Parvularcula sp. LCG005 TaxID=3078805 RepID=UPI0029431335|nr:succinylglutamate-semialdehyde dehydrogenase [Parvularcula sp. LCG005]WOI53586.1 succinylglutamate-semialdehyde dehydrogenase [Parvularcula sp. LCG005]